MSVVRINLCPYKRVQILENMIYELFIGTNETGRNIQVSIERGSTGEERPSQSFIRNLRWLTIVFWSERRP